MHWCRKRDYGSFSISGGFRDTITRTPLNAVAKLTSPLVTTRSGTGGDEDDDAAAELASYSENPRRPMPRAPFSVPARPLDTHACDDGGNREMARAATIIQPIPSQLVTKQGGVLELTAVQVSNGACMPTRTRKCSSEFRILRCGRRARLRNCSGKLHLFIDCVGSDTSGGPATSARSGHAVRLA